MIQTEDINAIIRIENGKVIIESISNTNGDIREEICQLIKLRDVVSNNIKDYERNHQKQYLPNIFSKYILPEDETPSS